MHQGPRLERAACPQFGNELRFREAGTGRLTGGYIPVDFGSTPSPWGPSASTPAPRTRSGAAIAAARAHDGVTVIHVAVSPDKRAPGYDSWWDVPVAAVSGVRAP